VFLWFVGGSVLVVWLVFRSPAIDYRLVVVGALLPLVELPIGEPRVLHSLTGAVVALGLAMVITPRRRLVQRRLVAIPIGMFLHLLLDAIWTDTRAFWWPFAGLAWSDAQLPELARGGLDVLLELAGAVVLVWCWRRFRLDEPDRRARFLRTGRLDRDVAVP
jgi:membrane-bound metal-dependent hydrolase YbcI (DUF457 family)